MGAIACVVGFADDAFWLSPPFARFEITMIATTTPTTHGHFFFLCSCGGVAEGW
jgi:hypothetical protein